MTPNSIKITGEKELRTALRGSTATFYVGFVLIIFLSVLFIFVLRDNLNNPEIGNMIICHICTFALLAFVTIYGSRRMRAAACSVRHLIKYNELEAAVADCNRDDNYAVADRNDSSARTPAIVLGHRFIFLFTHGRILHFYQIASLSIVNDGDNVVLRMMDTSKRKYDLVITSRDETDIIFSFIKELEKRYPGCPSI